MPSEGDCFDINALGFAENFLREQKRKFFEFKQRTRKQKSDSQFGINLKDCWNYSFVDEMRPRVRKD
ncbi:MAG TPA: hypothetical protein VHV54_10845 [Candidatus Binatia bacterium]|nr:hypothetical protein [Candidatus Binatia bacterium]